MIKVFFILLCHLVFLACINAQTEAENRKLIEISREFGLVSILYQADSPVIIEEVQLLTDQQVNFPKLRYVVKNRSDREVVSVSVEFHQQSKVRTWVPYSDSWIETTGKRDSKIILIKPGGVYENMEKIRIRPTPAIRELPEILDSSKGNSKLLTFWIGFVKQVVFKDGSEYNVVKVGDDISEILVKN